MAPCAFLSPPSSSYWRIQVSHESKSAVQNLNPNVRIFVAAARKLLRALGRSATCDKRQFSWYTAHGLSIHSWSRHSFEPLPWCIQREIRSCKLLNPVLRITRSSAHCQQIEICLAVQATTRWTPGGTLPQTGQRQPGPSRTRRPRCCLPQTLLLRSLQATRLTPSQRQHLR